MTFDYDEDDARAVEEWRNEIASKAASNHTIAELEQMRDTFAPNATGSIWDDAIRIASERIMQSALTYTEACEAEPSLWPPIPAVEMGRSLER